MRHRWQFRFIHTPASSSNSLFKRKITCSVRNILPNATASCGEAPYHCLAAWGATIRRKVISRYFKPIEYIYKSMCCIWVINPGRGRSNSTCWETQSNHQPDHVPRTFTFHRRTRSRCTVRLTGKARRMTKSQVLLWDCMATLPPVQKHLTLPLQARRKCLWYMMIYQCWRTTVYLYTYMHVVCIEFVISIFAYIYTYVYVCMYIYIYMCVCVHMHFCMHINVWYTYVRVYTYIYIYTYKYICIYEQKSQITNRKNAINFDNYSRGVLVLYTKYGEMYCTCLGYWFAHFLRIQNVHVRTWARHIYCRTNIGVPGIECISREGPCWDGKSSNSIGNFPRLKKNSKITRG